MSVSSIEFHRAVVTSFEQKADGKFSVDSVPERVAQFGRELEQLNRAIGQTRAQQLHARSAAQQSELATLLMTQTAQVAQYQKLQASFENYLSSKRALSKLENELVASGTKQVRAISIHEKCGNTEKRSDTSIYMPPTGYFIESFTPHEQSKYGHTGYHTDLMAPESSYTFQNEVIHKYNDLIDLAASKAKGGKSLEEYKAKLQRAKEDYSKRMTSSQTTHQTLAVKWHVGGKGVFQGGGSLNLEVDVTLVPVESVVARFPLIDGKTAEQIRQELQ